MSGGRKFSRNEQAALAALLSEPSVEEAAGKAGVSERTLYRWLNDPDFVAEYRRARLHLVDETVASLQRAGKEAVEALRRNLRAESEAVQVRAARSLIELEYKGTEFTDISHRIAELEDIIAKIGGSP